MQAFCMDSPNHTLITDVDMESFIFLKGPENTSTMFPTIVFVHFFRLCIKTPEMKENIAPKTAIILLLYCIVLPLAEVEKLAYRR